MHSLESSDIVAVYSAIAAGIVIHLPACYRNASSSTLRPQGPPPGAPVRMAHKLLIGMG